MIRFFSQLVFFHHLHVCDGPRQGVLSKVTYLQWIRQQFWTWQEARDHHGNRYFPKCGSKSKVIQLLSRHFTKSWEKNRNNGPINFWFVFLQSWYSKVYVKKRKKRKTRFFPYENRISIFEVWQKCRISISQQHEMSKLKLKLSKLKKA